MTDKAYAEINGIVLTSPKLIKTNKGYVTNFYVEVIRDNTGIKDKFKMTAFNEIAENCAKYLKDGNYIRTKCKIKTVEIAGGKLYLTEFIINYIKFDDMEEFENENF